MSAQRIRKALSHFASNITPRCRNLTDGLTFSRDGNYIYYTKSEKNNPPVLYRMPVLGHAAVKLVEDVNTPITLSPDGKRLAFVRHTLSQKESVLMVANADGTGEQKLVIRKLPDAFLSPTWSPDGETIACAAANYGTGGLYMNVVAARAADGAEKPIGSQKWAHVRHVAWLADGPGLLLTAEDQGEWSHHQIWHLSYPSGEARRITNDLSSYKGVSLTADSSTLVTVQSDTTSSIWTMTLTLSGDAGVAKQITSNKSDERPSWTPDGKIVMTQERVVIRISGSRMQTEQDNIN